jgi:hypothetical protein
MNKPCDDDEQAFNEPLQVHKVTDIRQAEMHMVESIEHPDSCSPEAEIAIAKMKRYKTSFAKILAELTQARSK